MVNEELLGKIEKNLKEVDKAEIDDALKEYRPILVVKDCVAYPCDPDGNIYSDKKDLKLHLSESDLLAVSWYVVGEPIINVNWDGREFNNAELETSNAIFLGLNKNNELTEYLISYENFICINFQNLDQIYINEVSNDKWEKLVGKEWADKNKNDFFENISSSTVVDCINKIYERSMLKNKEVVNMENAKDVNLEWEARKKEEFAINPEMKDAIFSSFKNLSPKAIDLVEEAYVVLGEKENYDRNGIKLGMLGYIEYNIEPNVTGHDLVICNEATAVIKNEFIQMYQGKENDRDFLVNEINKNPDAIRFMKYADEELKIMAVSIQGYAIKDIDNPSAAVKVAALKNQGLAIGYITDPDEFFQFAAVKNNINAIGNIKNPTDMVCEYVIDTRINKMYPIGFEGESTINPKHIFYGIKSPSENVIKSVMDRYGEDNKEIKMVCENMLRGKDGREKSAKSLKEIVQNTPLKSDVEKINKNPWSIGHMVNPVKSLVLLAVSKDGDILQLFPAADKEIQLAGVGNQPSAIRYILEPDKDVQMKAYTGNPNVYSLIKNPDQELVELHRGAVKQGKDSMGQVSLRQKLNEALLKSDGSRDNKMKRETASEVDRGR